VCTLQVQSVIADDEPDVDIDQIVKPSMIEISVPPWRLPMGKS